jgi:hypothetical protein
VQKPGGSQGDLDNLERNFWGTNDERVAPSCKKKEAETKECEAGSFDFTKDAARVMSEGSSGTTGTHHSFRTRADYDKNDVINDMAIVVPGRAGDNGFMTDNTRGSVESRSFHHGDQDEEDEIMEEASGLGSESVYHRKIPVSNVVDDEMSDVSMKSDFVGLGKSALATERQELARERENLARESQRLAEALEQFIRMKGEFEAIKAGTSSSAVRR